MDSLQNKDLFESKLTYPLITSRGEVLIRMHACSYGLGLLVIHFTGLIDAVLLFSLTPIDDRCVDVRVLSSTLGNPSHLSEAYQDELIRQFNRDAVILQHKKYVAHPLLAAEDGPIAPFRRWAKHFLETQG